MYALVGHQINLSHNATQLFKQVEWPLVVRSDKRSLSFAPFQEAF